MVPPTDPTTDAAACAEALALLGLPRTATGEQVVHAYRRLARATHPDATGRSDPAAARRFAAIHDAYDLLTHAAPEPARPPAGNAAEGRAAAPAFGARPPIVAGPVVVTPLPERHRRHGPEPR